MIGSRKIQGVQLKQIRLFGDNQSNQLGEFIVLFQLKRAENFPCFWFITTINYYIKDLQITNYQVIRIAKRLTYTYIALPIFFLPECISNTY